MVISANNKSIRKTILAIGYYHHNQTIILTGENMNTNIQQTNMQYKEIPISQLPECFFKERLSNMVIDPDKASVIVVARLGVIGDWASYIGYPSYDELSDWHKNRETIQYYCNTLRTPSQVSAYGDKLSKDIAEQLFPEWAYRSYRE